MDDSPDFRVRLPENCSIEDVIEIVNDLPTVPSNDAGLDGRLLFKPPTDNPIIDFDLRRTTRITPEACGALFALIEWLGAHAATTVTVQLPATSFKAVVFKKLLLQPVDATTDPSASVTPIANIAQQLGDEMLDELNVAPHAQCREWLKFALYETLLNVAQHSKLATDNDVSAYVAVSIDSGAPANNVPRKSGATSPATDAAEPRRITPSTVADGYVEVAVVDVGEGIPQSLFASFSASNPEASEMAKGAVGPVGWRTKHNATLLWSLTPFGTRKKLLMHAPKRLQETFRGLYRLFNRTTATGGAVAICSGFGRVETKIDEIGRTRLTLPRTKTKKGVPWTAVVSRFPVSFEKTANAQRTEQPDGSTRRSIAIDRNVLVQCTPDIQALSMDTIPAYWEAVELALRRAESDSSRENPNVLPLPTFWLVIHPGLPIHGSLSAPAADERVLETLAHYLDACTHEGRVYIHYCLASDLDAEHILHLEAFVQATAASKHVLGSPLPELGSFGVCLAGSSHVRWVNRYLDTDDTEPMIVNESSPVDLRGPLLGYFTSIQSLWPRSLVDATLSKDVSLDASCRDAALSTFLREHVSRVSSSAQALTGVSWYWSNRSLSEQNNYRVVTRSGQPVSEYLSVLGFCRASPHFEISITKALGKLLGRLARGGNSVWVVPDSDESSYLLMRRIETHVRNYQSTADGSLSFLAPSDLGIANEPPRHVVIFGDFRHEGTTIKKRRTQLEELFARRKPQSARAWEALPEQKTEYSCFVCVDAARPSVKVRNSDWHEFLSPCVYELNDEPTISDLRAVLLKIDPVTSDLIPFEQSLTLSRYLGLEWRTTKSMLEPSPVEQVLPPFALLSSRNLFDYGLQFVGGRYFFCRWPVKKNFRRTNELLSRCEKAICDWIAEYLHTTTRDIVVVSRSNSDIADEVEKLVVKLRATLSREGRTVIGMRLETVSRYGKQFLSHALPQTLRAYADGRQFGEPHVQGEMFANAVKRRELREIAVVFFDNSAMSGRAISELLASTQVIDEPWKPYLRSILLFPVVTRLNPTEEAVLESTTLRAIRSTQSPRIDVSFVSLIQMRLKSYTSHTELPLYREIDSMIERSADEPEPALVEIREWFKSTRRAIISLQTRNGAFPITCPVRADLQVEGSTVSVDAIKFRQLVALRPQGIPCWSEIIGLVKGMQEVGDTSLATVLALEPELLREDALLVELGPDIAKLCLGIVRDFSNTRDMLNAVWVLSHVGYGFADVPNVALKIPTQEGDSVLTVFSFLALYGRPGPRNLRAIDAGISAMRTSIHGNSQRKILHGALEEAFHLLSVISEPISDPVSAKKAIKRFIAQGRYTHGSDGAAVWQNFCEWFEQHAANGATPLAMPPIGNRTVVAHEWFRQVLLPLHDAVAVLFRSARLPSGTHEEVRRRKLAIRRAFTPLFSAEESSAAHLAAQIPWQKMRFFGIVGNSNSVFASPARIAAFHQRAANAKAANVSGDAMLANCVVEPSAFILSKVQSAFEQLEHVIVDFQWRVAWHNNAVDVRLYVGALDQCDLTSKLWLGADKLGISLLWAPELLTLSETVSICLLNAVKYANLGHPAGINVRLEHYRQFEGAGVTAALRITTVVDITKKNNAGNGQGKEIMAEHMKGIAGTYDDTESSEALHVDCMRFPIDWVNFSGDWS